VFGTLPSFTVPVATPLGLATIRPPSTSFATPTGLATVPTATLVAASPLGQAIQLRHLGRLIGTLATLQAINPSSVYMQGYNPYMSSYAYGSYPMSSSMSTGGGMTPATTTASYTSPYSATLTSTAGAPQSGKAPQEGNLLTALGLSSSGNNVDWPVGLQVLFPQKENQELLAQINATLAVAAQDRAAGRTNAELGKSGKRAVDRLEELLERRQDALSPHDYREAQQFVERLRTAMNAIAS